MLRTSYPSVTCRCRPRANAAYGHVIPELKREAAAMIDEVLKRKS